MFVVPEGDYLAAKLLLDFFLDQVSGAGYLLEQDGRHEDDNAYYQQYSQDGKEYTNALYITRSYFLAHTS